MEGGVFTVRTNSDEVEEFHRQNSSKRYHHKIPQRSVQHNSLAESTPATRQNLPQVERDLVNHPNTVSSATNYDANSVASMQSNSSFIESLMSCFGGKPAPDYSTRPSSDIFDISIDFDDVLGSGSEGCVYTGYMSPKGNPELSTEVAIKEIYSTRHSKSIEWKRLFELRHVNICRMIQFYNMDEQSDHNQSGMMSNGRQSFLVMEYCAHGSLYLFMTEEREQSRWKKISPAFVVRAMRHLALAVQYLHQNKVLHRDIKPDNALVTTGKYPTELEDWTRDEAGFNFKLSDFGLSAIIPEGMRSKKDMSDTHGTRRYQSPEIFHGNRSLFSFGSDVWAYGVLCWGLLFAQAPYGTKMIDVQVTIGVVNRNLELPFPKCEDSFPALFRTLLEVTLQYDRKRRASFATLVELLSGEMSLAVRDGLGGDMNVKQWHERRELWHRLTGEFFRVKLSEKQRFAEYLTFVKDKKQRPNAAAVIADYRATLRPMSQQTGLYNEAFARQDSCVDSNSNSSEGESAQPEQLSANLSDLEEEMWRELEARNDPKLKRLFRRFVTAREATGRRHAPVQMARRGIRRVKSGASPPTYEEVLSGEHHLSQSAPTMSPRLPRSRSDATSSASSSPKLAREEVDRTRPVIPNDTNHEQNDDADDKVAVL